MEDLNLSNRSILIFDEPTSGLDFMNMKEVSNEMMRLKEGGETIFIITHNPELVESCCDYFMFMENGKVKWHGIKAVSYTHLTLPTNREV